MRAFSRALLALAATLLLAPGAHAQAEKRFSVDKNNGVQVGFQNVLRTTTSDGFKTGMWTPVIVELKEDEDGEIRLPVEKDKYVSGEILVETADNDGVVNTYPQAFTKRLDESGGTVRVLAYSKVGNRNPDVRVSVKAGKQTVQVWSRSYNALQVGTHLYLMLGESLPDFHEALVQWNSAAKGQGQQFGPNGQPVGQAPGAKNTHPRYAVFENSVQDLPAQWFGYSAVDLAVLPTAAEDFLKKLVGTEDQGTDQLRALADWVSRGGRLVISVSGANRQLVQRLLMSKAWQPALPRVLRPESPMVKLQAMHSLPTWTLNVHDPMTMPKGGATIVQLERLPQVEVMLPPASEIDNPAPLIVRVPHGMGNLVLLAFDVKSEPVSTWKGRYKFWEKLVKTFAPNSEGGFFDDNGQPIGPVSGRQDISTQINNELDKFDSPSVSFGWVVLFIFLYILVVGPIDYLLLKLVFKRLELTWLTFPAVVVTVSVLAYFTAYTLKGKDLKINKIDLIDVDMRSKLGEDGRPAGATAYGTTWFTILSPRIQNYTIGIEPIAAPWLLSVDPANPGAPTVTWLGRAEPAGMGGTGRGRSQGLFNRTYSYEANATGLRDVPIPVWTTKSFTASWSAPFAQLPLEVDLHYEVGPVENLSGTIKSNLPVVLLDVGIIYREKWYALKNNKGFNQLAKEDGSVQVRLDKATVEELGRWANTDQKFGADMPQPNWQRPQDPYYNDSQSTKGLMQDPWVLLRRLYFYEQAHNGMENQRNHVLRRLDWSWRAKKDDSEDGRLRELVLVARLAPALGQADTLQKDNDPRLATLLWLGALPGGEKTRPALEGNLVQYTYVRFVLPVVPRKAPLK